MKDVSRKNILFLWKVEQFRQFTRKFSDLILLKEIRNVYDAPYYTVVSTTDMSVGLRALLKISRYCEISELSGKTRFRCMPINEGDLTVDEVVTAVLGIKNKVQTEYIGSQVNYFPPLPLEDKGIVNLDYTDFDSKDGPICDDQQKADAVSYQMTILNALYGTNVELENCENAQREMQEN